MINKFLNWLVNSELEIVFKTFLKVWIVWVLFVLLGIAGLIYVGVHFLIKYW